MLDVQLVPSMYDTGLLGEMGNISPNNLKLRPAIAFFDELVPPELERKLQLKTKPNLYQRPYRLTCMCPFPHSDRHNFPGFVDEFVPGITAGIDDFFIALEYSV